MLHDNIFINRLVAFVFGFSLINGSLLADDQLGRNHALLTRAFEKHVKDGLVDYESIKNDQNFDEYLAWLAEADTSQFESRNDAMAFWVNAYNALAIKGVIENWPLNRVVDVPGFFNKKKYRIVGAQLTLDDIEKGIIYKTFDEPRLHFVLVCAAMSCPKLPSSAYSSTDIVARMEQTTRAFLNNPERNRLDRNQKVLYLSQIFSWYKGDFSNESKSVIDFVKPYFSEEEQEFLTKHPVVIDYLEYDWSLNDLKS